MIDLQAHTTASDGTLSPTELVGYAAERGVTVLGVTDHDTTAGIAEAAGAGRSRGVEIVPGIELSCRDGARPVHVLGLFVDPDHPGVLAYADRLRAERQDRGRRMVQRLNELGYDISYDEVAAKAVGGMVGRPHVARALADRGHIPDVSSAFTPHLIADGGRADVPRAVLDPIASVSEIRSWGGVAVLAHGAARHHGGPAIEVAEELIERMAEAGMGGVEVDHPDHDRRARRAMRAVARRLGLVETGGSDCHGPHSAPPGRCTTSPEALDRLRQLAGAG